MFRFSLPAADATPTPETIACPGVSLADYVAPFPRPEMAREPA